MGGRVGTAGAEAQEADGADGEHLWPDAEGAALPTLAASADLRCSAAKAQGRVVTKDTSAAVVRAHLTTISDCTSICCASIAHALHTEPHTAAGVPAGPVISRSRSPAWHNFTLNSKLQSTGRKWHCHWCSARPHKPQIRHRTHSYENRPKGKAAREASRSTDMQFSCSDPALVALRRALRLCPLTSLWLSDSIYLFLYP